MASKNGAVTAAENAAVAMDIFDKNAKAITDAIIRLRCS